MQDKPQETGMATPTEGPSTASASTNTPPKPAKYNRKQRRQLQAFQKKAQTMANSRQRVQLDQFKVLAAWKDKEAKLKNRMTDDQIASVFRVALARLFKGKEIVRKREKVSFDDQLRAIIRNVKKGFKYKSDVAPAAPLPEAVEKPAAE